MPKITTKDQIVEAADLLFYQQGFEYTSFADIADIVQISRGNFYHHFKTKDDILAAVISTRLAKTKGMFVEWENIEKSPEARIRCFINILLVNGGKIKKYGCPVGTLVTELSKLNHASKSEATRVFTLFRSWLRGQFKDLGHIEQADELAMHLLTRSQGVATLYSAFQDDEFVHQEIAYMENWLQAYC